MSFLPWRLFAFDLLVGVLALFGLVRQVGRLDERLKIASQRTRFFKKEINNTIIQHAYETFFMSDQIPDFQD
mgnify:FL=1|jgi:hypothetical protein